MADLTWLILAYEVVLHVASVVVPLIEISPAQTRKSGQLVVHDHAGFTATGGFVNVPVPASPSSPWLHTELASGDAVMTSHSPEGGNAAICPLVKF